MFVKSFVIRREVKNRGPNQLHRIGWERMWKHALLSALCFYSCCLPACSNPTPIGGSGTELAPFSLKKLPDVSIAEERLTIEDGKQDSVPGFSPRVKTMSVPCVLYRAEYRFNNTSGEPKTIRVGFPTVTYRHLAGGDYGGLSSFKVIYKGKEIPVKTMTYARPTLYPRTSFSKVEKDLLSAGLAQQIPECPEFLDLAGLGSSRQDAAKVLQETNKFSKKEIAFILEALDRNVFSQDDFKICDQNLEWTTFEFSLPQGLSDVLSVSYKSIMPALEDNYQFAYILKTAKFWGNRLGRLEIVIKPDVGFLERGGTYHVHPEKTFQMTQNPVSFVYKSAEYPPQFNINVKRALSN